MDRRSLASIRPAGHSTAAASGIVSTGCFRRGCSRRYRGPQDRTPGLLPSLPAPPRWRTRSGVGRRRPIAAESLLAMLHIGYAFIGLGWVTVAVTSVGSPPR